MILRRAYLSRCAACDISQPNSSLLATTSYSGDVDLWQLPDGKSMKSLKISDREITGLAFLSDSVLAAAASEMSLWDVARGQKVTTLTTKFVRDPALALSRDRRLLAFNDSDTNSPSTRSRSPLKWQTRHRRSSAGCSPHRWKRSGGREQRED